MILSPCGESALAVELVTVPEAYAYPLFYRCTACGVEWHRGWAPHWRAKMEALAELHMSNRHRPRYAPLRTEARDG